MRLDKLICHATALTRSDCGKVIRQGRVQVHGQVVRQAAAQVGESDPILLDGEPVRYFASIYLMLHKPADYICSHEGGGYPTVFSLLPPELRQVKELNIAGRLDKDVTGLVLLANDGQWLHRVTSPRVGKEKHYRVETALPLSAEDGAAFAAGMLLEGEEKATKSARLVPLGERIADLYLGEGRYHQVKRMFAARGNSVVKLHRLAAAGILLDPELAEGGWRPLTPAEIASVGQE